MIATRKVDETTEGSSESVGNIEQGNYFLSSIMNHRMGGQNIGAILDNVEEVYRNHRDNGICPLVSK